MAAPLKAHKSERRTPHNIPMKSLSEMEKEYILMALDETNWNISGRITSYNVCYTKLLRKNNQLAMIQAGIFFANFSS